MAKDEIGSFYSHAFTDFEFSKDLKPSLARRALEEIIRAPGKDMSQSDRLSLPKAERYV